MKSLYNGRFRDIPIEAVTDWYQGAIKYNFDAKRYGVTTLMLSLTPVMVLDAVIHMTLDKLLLEPDFSEF